MLHAFLQLGGVHPAIRVPVVDLPTRLKQILLVLGKDHRVQPVQVVFERVSFRWVFEFFFHRRDLRHLEEGRAQVVVFLRGLLHHGVHAPPVHHHVRCAADEQHDDALRNDVHHRHRGRRPPHHRVRDAPLPGRHGVVEVPHQHRDEHRVQEDRHLQHGEHRARPLAPPEPELLVLVRRERPVPPVEELGLLRRLLQVRHQPERGQQVPLRQLLRVGRLVDVPQQRRGRRREHLLDPAQVNQKDDQKREQRPAPRRRAEPQQRRAVRPGDGFDLQEGLHARDEEEREEPRGRDAEQRLHVLRQHLLHVLHEAELLQRVAQHVQLLRPVPQHGRQHGPPPQEEGHLVHRVVVHVHLVLGLALEPVPFAKLRSQVRAHHEHAKHIRKHQTSNQRVQLTEHHRHLRIHRAFPHVVRCVFVQVPCGRVLIREQDIINSAVESHIRHGKRQRDDQP
mmetsp:Transcript_6264/g.15523  ORF Transcript_6264/g.15523 Transcript_6264/m.15523 type:complete len:451 (+) Transcript_6264:1686-3038(+)